MKKIFIPLLTVVVLVSIIFTGCVPGAAPPVTPPPVTPPPVTPPVEPVTPPVVEEKVFKFGALLPLSGVGAGWATKQTAALEIAADLINEAGGMRVGDDIYMWEVHSWDHAWDSSIAVTVAREAIYEEQIRYLNVWSDAEIEAMRPITDKEGVLVIGAIAAYELLGPDKPLTWTELTYGGDFIEVLYTYVRETYPDIVTAAGLFVDDPGGYESAERWQKVVEYYGFEVTDIAFIPLEVTDFYPMLTPVVAKDPGIIELFDVSPGLTVLIMKQARELGFTGRFAVSPPYVTFDEMAEGVGLEGIEGTIFGSMPGAMMTETSREWLERFVIKTGYRDLYWSKCLDMLMLLKLAIEKANTLDALEVAQAMETVTYEGSIGLTFYGGEELVGANRIYTVPAFVSEVIDGQPVEIFSGVAQRLWLK